MAASKAVFGHDRKKVAQLKSIYMFGLLFIILILTLSHRIMYVLAVNLSIIAFITHAHRHNVNLHPRDRYLVEATRGHGCENLVQLCQHMYCQNNLGDQKCCSV